MAISRPAVSYLRRSTDRQEQSISDQRSAILRFASEHGFTLVDEYCDDGISGTAATTRAAFQRLIADSQNGHSWRHVLVYDVKRFGRVDNDEAGYYRHILRRAGVEVIYISENFSDDETSDLLRPVKQWQAREESRSLSRVTIRGQLSLSDGGWWVGGAPPYGYDLLYHDSSGQPYQTLRFLPDASKQVLDMSGEVVRTLPKGERLSHSKKDRMRLTPSSPERVAVVRRIFEMYVSGMGHRSIAERLNEEGIPSPRNRSWSQKHDGHWALTTVRAIILNPVYGGDMVWNRRTFGKFHRITDGRATKRSATVAGKWGSNSEGDWVIVRDAHPALIDRELWRRSQAIRNRRREKHPGSWNSAGRGKSSPFLLTGLIRCEACGHKFQGYTITKSGAKKNGDKVKTRYYGCGGYITKGNSVCKKVLIRRDRLDEQVMALVEKQVTKLLGNGGMKLLRRLVKEELGSGGEDPRPEMARLRKRLTEIDESADRLLDTISPENQDFVNRKLARLRSEKQQAETRLQDLQATHYEPPDVESTVDSILAQLKDFPRVAAQGTVEERKQFVRAFVQGITIRPHEARGTVQVRALPLPETDLKARQLEIQTTG